MKIMKYSKLLLLLMMILPWFSLQLMGKSSVKRFLPAGLFISCVVRIINFIAKKQKWWWWYEKLHPKVSGVTPFILGPFLIGSMWILKLTYGKFFRYMTLNLIIDSLFTFFGVKWLQKFGIASLVRLNKIQLLLIMTIEALVLYLFQYYIVQIKRDSNK